MNNGFRKIRRIKRIRLEIEELYRISMTISKVFTDDSEIHIRVCGYVMRLAEYDFSVSEYHA